MKIRCLAPAGTLVDAVARRLRLPAQRAPGHAECSSGGKSIAPLRRGAARRSATSSTAQRPGGKFCFRFHRLAFEGIIFALNIFAIRIVTGAETNAAASLTDGW
jgi:hypothetical protein